MVKCPAYLCGILKPVKIFSVRYCHFDRDRGTIFVIGQLLKLTLSLADGETKKNKTFCLSGNL